MQSLPASLRQNGTLLATTDTLLLRFNCNPLGMHINIIRHSCCHWPVIISFHYHRCTRTESHSTLHSWIRSNLIKAITALYTLQRLIDNIPTIWSLHTQNPSHPQSALHCMSMQQTIRIESCKVIYYWVMSTHRIIPVSCSKHTHTKGNFNAKTRPSEHIQVHTVPNVDPHLCTCLSEHCPFQSNPRYSDSFLFDHEYRTSHTRTLRPHDKALLKHTQAIRSVTTVIRPR